MKKEYTFLRHIVVSIGCFIGLTGALHMIFARDITVRSSKMFERVVRRYEHSIVMFYRIDRDTKRDKKEYKKMLDLEAVFRRLSSDPHYKEGDLHFMKLNVASKDLEIVATDMDLQEFPAFVLYKDDGRPLKDKDGKVALLKGLATGAQLRAFIDKYLGDDLQDIIDQKKEERKRRLEEARISSYSVTPTFWYSGGYPWYGYYPYHYWHHPYHSYGFGVGFGW